MTAPARRGDWMQTASGGAFWPTDPRPEDIHLVDIAHALAHLCRYAGHCAAFYSVAQHSVLVSRAVAPEVALWGLLHDAAEAYVVDIPRPLKRYLSGYAEIEAAVMAAVCEKFDLPPDMPPEVKRADNAILADEAAQLMLPPPRDRHLTEPPLGIDITPWTPDFAKAAFINAFCEYSVKRVSP